MAASQHEDKMFGLQRQLVQNQKDLQDFLSDLGSWEDDIKEKEKQMLKKKSDEPQTVPPVRNSLDKKKLKKKKKKKAEHPPEKKKISGFDFRAWDKFDVDKALEDIDKEEGKKSSSEYETDEEWETERKKHLANEEKNTGNAHLSAGAHEVAVECYTRGMALDPTNALLPANRALALIKMEKYGAAEVDCSTAITLDPLYVKAYLRRATARVGMSRLPAALEDYQRVLQLEPQSKQARAEVDRLQKEIEREKEGSKTTATSLEKTLSSEVKAVYKAPEQRSKKPLRRIEIEEIGLKDDTERKAAIAQAEAQQSSAKKAMEAKDSRMFEKFTIRASGDMGESDPPMQGRASENSALLTETETETAKRSDRKIQEISSSSEMAGDSSKNQQAAGVGSRSAQQTSNDLRKKKKKEEGGGGGLQNGSAGSKPSSPREMDPPQTSYQFQTDFKVLKNDLPAFYAYFKRIDPAMYPKLFGKCLESPMLLKIVEALRTCAIPAGEDFYQQLKSLCEVNRFSTTVMFFSNKEKQGIRELFQFLKSKGSHAECDIDSLMKKYEV